MNAAPFRITLGKDGKRPRSLSRLASCGNLDGAVLCAQQWTIWSNAPGRGKRDKYGWYRVETRDEQSAWCQVSAGTLDDARMAWTAEDDARIDAEYGTQPFTAAPGAIRHSKARTGRTPRAQKSRLAQLVGKVLDQRQ